MDIVTFLPFIVLIGAMFLMTRSAKKKQQAAATMRNEMQPGTGVRTIGGMYAVVKEVTDDTATLEVAPGVHAIYAKNAIGAVLDDEEYNRIVHGAEQDLKSDTPVVPDDASSLTENAEDAAPAAAGDSPVDFAKKDTDADKTAEADAGKAAQADADKAADTDEDAPKKDEDAPKKTDGEADAK
ncbi:preprotein translocase subunit YajC [Streptomyces sp. B-S-A8]|uniref:Preprotein translocase subunit YajC n=1 Tax=Streptomyces solicavernae TaxID=3043614 RepID=A0ABT6RSN2_9ACTN|nr:preprotein translocase subunit YajC [Streptomyces sp. B-S-A8]MDI3386768.1 preprotein translocase subunit YajC [Streptomyces sp. B-S-A8]